MSIHQSRHTVPSVVPEGRERCAPRRCRVNTARAFGQLEYVGPSQRREQTRRLMSSLPTSAMGPWGRQQNAPLSLDVITEAEATRSALLGYKAPGVRDEERLELLPLWPEGFEVPPVSSIPFPPADMLTVRELDTSGQAPVDLRQLGALTRSEVDKHLGPGKETAGVLLRNLPMRTAEDFGEFLEGAMQAGQAAGVKGWQQVNYEPFGGPRKKVAGLDLATNIPGRVCLQPHNEMCYNPKPNNRISLYCLQDAMRGGETLVTSNYELTMKAVPAELMDFCEKHNGAQYRRKYYNKKAKTSGVERPPWEVSWQDRCRLPEDASREDAEQFWLDLGFSRGDITWEENGDLSIVNKLAAMREDPSAPGRKVWFNHVDKMLTAGDGTPVPPELGELYRHNRWSYTYGLALRPGDWLVLDNIKAQHGRMPYQDWPQEDKKRQMITVLTV